MSPDDFAFLAEFLRRRSGLLLVPQKTHLIEGRLGPVARRFGFRDTAALLSELRHAPETLARAVTEAMTTNDSRFFRDRPVFEHLKTAILPALMDARADEKRLRIWCAACAAGQEAYSVAMLLDDFDLVNRRWAVDLIATDLNSSLVTRAEQGAYSEHEVETGLTQEQLAKHFSRHGEIWRANDSLRRAVSFRRFNLLDSCGWLHPLDLVLCRNVFMYLEPKARVDVIGRIADVLAPDGVLVIGDNESIRGLGDDFERLDAMPGFYRLRPRNAAMRLRA